MKRNHIITLFVASAIAASCSNNTIDKLHFEARLANTAEIMVGDTVEFELGGNPDYLIFYSGENGARYENRSNFYADVEEVSLSYTAQQQYTAAEWQKKKSMSILVSSDLKSYSSQDVSSATWTELTAFKPLIPVSSDLVKIDASGKLPFSEQEKTQYIAFRYKVAKQTMTVSNDYSKPKVEITQLTMTKRLKRGGTVSISNPLKEFCFNTVVVSGTADSIGTSVKASSILVQPKKISLTEDTEVWIISKAIERDYVGPDKGTSIKNLSYGLPVHKHVYDTPGTYTATFVATNANMWNSDSQVKEVTVVVKEKK